MRAAPWCAWAAASSASASDVPGVGFSRRRAWRRMFPARPLASNSPGDVFNVAWAAASGGAGQRQLLGGNHGIGAKTPLRAFPALGHALAVDRRNGVDHLRQQQLVVLAAHAHLAHAGVQGHVFHGQRELERIGRLRFVHCRGQEAHGHVDARGEKILAGFRLVGLGLGIDGRPIGLARVPFGDPGQLALAGLGDGQHGAGNAARAVVEVAVVKAGVARRLEQQGHVLAPVAGDEGVGAGCLDLGDIGREILDAAYRVQRLADEPDVGAGRGHHAAAIGRPLLAVGVVLVEQVDVLDGGLGLDVVADRLHAHRGIGIEHEVPEIAGLARELGVYRRMVEHQHFLARIALVVARGRLHQGRHHRRARAAGDDGARPLVYGRLQRALAFLRRQLAVELQQLQLGLAGQPALGVDLLDRELHMVEHQLADVDERPGQRIDVGDLERFLGLGAGGAQQGGRGQGAQRKGGHGRHGSRSPGR